MSSVEDEKSSNLDETPKQEEKEEKREEQSSFTHDELVNLTKEAIRNIIESDPLLSDLPLDPTAEEIKAQTAVAQGQAILIFLDRGYLPKLSIVVPPRNTTVLDLKKAIKRQTNLALKREHVNRKISWKHVWKKYSLSFDDVILKNDNEDIQSYGIINKTTLKYVKRKRIKHSIYDN